MLGVAREHYRFGIYGAEEDHIPGHGRSIYRKLFHDQMLMCYRTTTLQNTRSEYLTMSSSTIILVTGANTGLGYVTVQALCSSQQHYTILLGGRSLEKATAAADELRPQLQGNSTVEPVQIDIEDDKSIEALVKTIQSKYGKLDVLLNNAGKSNPRHSTGDSSTDISQAASSINRCQQATYPCVTCGRNRGTSMSQAHSSSPKHSLLCSSSRQTRVCSSSPAVLPR